MSEHRPDPARKDEPNRWLGAATCRCVCGCRFVALGDYFGKPLCAHCEADDWPLDLDALTGGIAHDFAVKFGGSTFPQAQDIERDLVTFLRARLSEESMRLAMKSLGVDLLERALFEALSWNGVITIHADSWKERHDIAKSIAREYAKLAGAAAKHPLNDEDWDPRKPGRSG